MPILTAGKTDSGFTLIELIVVVLLIALSLSLIVGINFKQRDSLQVKSTARQLYSFLLSARSSAILNHQVNRCWYIPEQGQIVSDLRQRSFFVPAGVSVLRPEQQKSAGEKVLLAYYYSDGSASSGNICLQSGARSMLLEIDPLLGFVSLFPGCATVEDSPL